MDDQTDPKDPLPGKTRPDKWHPARLPPSDHMSGHRAHMRAKVMEKGAGMLSELELLEMILYAGSPRRDTKPLAKDLIRHFGSLSAVLRAPQAQLIALDGVGEAAISAIYIVARHSRPDAGLCARGHQQRAETSRQGCYPCPQPS